MKLESIVVIVIILLVLVWSVILMAIYIIQHNWKTEELLRYDKEKNKTIKFLTDRIFNYNNVRSYLYGELLNDVELFTDLKLEGIDDYFLYYLKKEGLTTLEKVENYKLADWLLFYDTYKDFEPFPEDESSLDTNLIDLFITILKKNYTNYDLTEEEEKKLFDTHDFSKVYKELEKYKEEHNLTKKDEETEEYKEKKGAEGNEDR